MSREEQIRTARGKNCVHKEQQGERITSVQKCNQNYKRREQQAERNTTKEHSTPPHSETVVSLA